MSNQDVTKGKPDPEIYHVAVKKLGMGADECLIVEDNKNGIMAAKAAGGHVMQVDSVYDVNYSNIKEHIMMAERGVI